MWSGMQLSSPNRTSLGKTESSSTRDTLGQKLAYWLLERFYGCLATDAAAGRHIKVALPVRHFDFDAVGGGNQCRVPLALDVSDIACLPDKPFAIEEADREFGIVAGCPHCDCEVAGPDTNLQRLFDGEKVLISPRRSGWRSRSVKPADRHGEDVAWHTRIRARLRPIPAERRPAVSICIAC